MNFEKHALATASMGPALSLDGCSVVDASNPFTVRIQG